MGKQEKATEGPYEIRVSENALKNIDEITGYIAFIRQEPANAIRVGDRIMGTIHRIGLHPFSFRECEELPTKSKIYRRAICLSWLIIFKIEQDLIIVLGIIHKSRRPARIKTLRDKK